jgi:CubicO group peptidase (beta-lactamase class C family)
MLKIPGGAPNRLARVLLLSACLAGLGNENVKAEPSGLMRDQVRSHLAGLTTGDGDPERSLAGLAVALMDDRQVIFEGAFGHARIDPNGVESRPLAPDSLIRVASISKTICTIAVMQSVDDGTLELDRDVSDYLGWTLRNPHYPDRPITLRQLLSHTSSIRDAGESYIIRYPRKLWEAFDTKAPEYPDRFQPADGKLDRGPGVFYEYSNLNYGVVGTILELVSGKRFDILMQERFYAPLNLEGGFNVATFTPDEQEKLATLYRKRDPDGIWRPNGPWVSQVDDLSDGVPTALSENTDYVPGTNGAQFSPQGGARLSLEGLEKLASLLMGDGAVGDLHILSGERMEEMRQTVWRYDPALRNMENYTGRLNERATGLRIMTGATPGDRLFREDQGRWYGHFGEAYGLLAGVWVQPESGRAIIYAITGTAFDPHAGEDGSSALAPIEAMVLEQLGRLIPRD